MLTGYFDDAAEKPWGEYLKGFLDPTPVMLPMNIFSEFSFPLSLTLAVIFFFTPSFVLYFPSNAFPYVPIAIYQHLSFSTPEQQTIPK